MKNVIYLIFSFFIFNDASSFYNEDAQNNHYLSKLEDIYDMEINNLCENFKEYTINKEELLYEKFDYIYGSNLKHEDSKILSLFNFYFNLNVLKCFDHIDLITIDFKTGEEEKDFYFFEYQEFCIQCPKYENDFKEKMYLEFLKCINYF